MSTEAQTLLEKSNKNVYNLLWTLEGLFCFVFNSVDA